MSQAQVDESMQQTAASISASAPIQADAVTTIVGAVYIKPQRMLSYRVRLSESIPATQAAQSMKTGFCAGRVNLAFMSKGVTYQYSVSTPTETFNITFSRKDCP